MLTKTPKSRSFKWLRKGALILLAAEATCFCVCYAAWYKVNTERESRKYLKENYPAILNYYYLFGEKLGKSSTRETDNLYWQNKLE